MASEKAVLEVFAVLGAAFPNFTATRETIVVYGRVLTDISDELVQAAALDCLSKCRFFPTIGELRDAAIAIRTNRQALPSAFEAWEEVTRGIRQYGHGRQPEFSHPWVGQAVRQIGGWDRICMSENSIADRARFFECFDECRRRNDMAEATLPAVKELAARLSSPRRPALPKATE